MKSDWRFSAGLAAVAAIVGLVVVPAVAKGSTLLSALAPVGRAGGIIFALIFGLIAAGKLLAGKRRGPPGASAPIPLAPAPVPTLISATHVVRGADRPANPALRSVHPQPAAKPTAWSLELLQSLDWKRFEEVVAAYFREKGFRSETIACGPDGGVDVRLYFRDAAAPVGVVQCKAWGRRKVDVAPVRELLGVMAHERVTRGYFAATGDFTSAATAFAAANPILLITGQDLLTAIAKMDAAHSAALLASAVEGDYTTPSCASCGEKLYRRKFKSGSTAWVCRGYPRCKTRIWTTKTA